MLILSRRTDESIVIDDSVVVTVLEVRGNKVRLAIQAHQDIPIRRGEVHAAMDRKKKARAQGQGEGE